MTQRDAEAQAGRLMAMRQAGETYGYVFDDAAPPDLAFAYDVQDRYLTKLGLAGSPAGYKVGATTPHMQARLGLDRPISGAVLGHRIFASPAALRADDYIRLGIECEIGVRVGRELPTEGPELSDPEFIAAHMDTVFAAFELITGALDPDEPGRPLSAASMVAINVWNGGLVMGPESPASAVTDYAALACVLSDGDGQVLDRGVSSDVLGNPLLVVGWLAGHLASLGRRLEPGQVVSTGSTTDFRRARAGERLRFVAGSLQPVELSLV